MIRCGNCGRDSPEGFAFCPHCGHPLGAAPAPLTERKVVTVLFCDLVGFTARSDRVDPEDVRAILQPFHALARSTIERFGGTLDKFIGDAALGVFGSPIAHEDDPERAVRASLALLDGIAELTDRRTGQPLAVRIGVNTGEAVVTLAAGVHEGESVTGDVVNTASRLQGAAAPGTALVAETTYLATMDAVEYGELEPVSVKGKPEPIRVWSPRSIRPIAAISDRPAGSPFVGRRPERTILEQTFLRTIRQGTVQLVTIVGEPGVGKSRLVAELGASIPRIAPGTDVRWRRGRCLPYGEGITFWALGEIVKGLAGIAESDATQDRVALAAAYLDRTVADPAERTWLRARLAPLLGVEAGPPVERAEAFTAWRRLLEETARQAPWVAVFEDLHWADPALLAFLEHLAEEAEPVPLLVIATTRPELYDRHRSWGAGMRNAVVVSLSPLSADETAELASNLLQAAELSEVTRSLLVDRSEGNPLYAEEFARTLRDRGLVDEHGQPTGDLAGIELPQSVQALIAARLDTLERDRKAVLQDASVIGKVFWSGGVASLSDTREDRVRAHLHELSKKELVRPAASSSLKDQAEFAFWHALTRDVAYGQIPRAERATKHRAATAWLESIAGERLSDLAEILAHHASTALELSEATGDTEAIPELRAAVARYLRIASGRTMALDVAKAEEQLRRALELTPPGHPDGARILAGLAEAAFQTGRLEEAEDGYKEATAGLLAQGDVEAAGEAMARQSVVLEYRGDVVAGRALLSEAIELLSSIPEGPGLARALATSAGSLMRASRYADTIPEADRAIELAERVGEPSAAARAHGFRGYVRSIRGEVEGVDEQRLALEMLRSLGIGRATAVTYNNLGSSLIHLEGPRTALEVFREGVAFAQSRGLRESVMAIQNSMLTALFEIGDWDEVLRLGEEVVREAIREGSTHDELFAEVDRALVQANRMGADARAYCESVLGRARPLEDPPMLVAGLAAAALARLSARDHPGAVELVREALELTREDPTDRLAELPGLVRVAVAANDLALGRALVDGVGALTLDRYRLAVVASEAALAEAALEDERALALYEDAAARWERWGHLPERAHALFGAARCLARLGRPGARERLRGARELFARLGAAPAVAQVDSFFD